MYLQQVYKPGIILHNYTFYIVKNCNQYNFIYHYILFHTCIHIHAYSTFHKFFWSLIGGFFKIVWNAVADIRISVYIQECKQVCMYIQVCKHLLIQVCRSHGRWLHDFEWKNDRFWKSENELCQKLKFGNYWLIQIFNIFHNNSL